MSDPDAATDAPSPPPNMMMPRAERSPWLAVTLDVLIAFAVIIGLSVALLTGWYAVRAATYTGVAADMSRQLGKPGVLFQIVSTIVSMGGATAVLLFWRRRPTPQERAQSLDAMRRRSTWGWALATGVVTTLLTLASTMAADAIGIQPNPSNVTLIRGLFAQYPWLLFPFAVCLAPLYEELMFRRVFYGRLQAAGRPVAGIVVSALLFALLHEMPGIGGNTLAATFVLWCVYAMIGACFALVYRRCGTIWAAIGAHATHNLLACLMLLGNIQTTD